MKHRGKTDQGNMNYDFSNLTVQAFVSGHQNRWLSTWDTIQVN